MMINLFKAGQKLITAPRPQHVLQGAKKKKEVRTFNCYLSYSLNN